MRNKNKPEIIVVDPRRTETAMASTLHLPLKPKSDMDLFYGIARILIERDWIDHEFLDAHTNGFAEFAEFVKSYTLDRVVAATGLSAESIQHFADLIHEGKRVSFWWTMGVNQSYQGVRTAQALINLSLMTGNIGKPGTGANSITGQCNAMGSRLFSNTTGLLGGHDFANAAHREKVAKILDIDEARIPREASWAYHEILEGVLKGKIRGLWIVCTNPAHSWINQRLCHDILDRLDFLVVQDMYHSTETAQRADLVLPAAGWGEKEGTFINSERRIGTIKKVRKAPGQALSDFSIFRLVADYWGCGEMFAKWDSPAAVFQIMKQLSAGQPCDITGIDGYAMLDECGGVQWPWARAEGGGRKADDDTQARRASEWSEAQDTALADDNGTILPVSQPSTFNTQPDRERRLFADGRFHHPDGRAKFLFENPKPMPEPASEKYPFVLLTGRGTASQWHTQTRTGKSDVLKKLYPEELYVEINPTDARTLGIRPTEWVSVESQRGHVRAQAFLTPIVPVGQVFLPMHYANANQLTDAVFDPYSKQPSYKSCAVRVNRVNS
jgi:assimilatory nitrate reductase catalytic subunit